MEKVIEARHPHTLLTLDQQRFVLLSLMRQGVEASTQTQAQDRSPDAATKRRRRRFGAGRRLHMTAPSVPHSVGMYHADVNVTPRVGTAAHGKAHHGGAVDAVGAATSAGAGAGVGAGAGSVVGGDAARDSASPAPSVPRFPHRADAPGAVGHITLLHKAESLDDADRAYLWRVFAARVASHLRVAVCVTVAPTPSHTLRWQHSSHGARDTGTTDGGRDDDRSGSAGGYSRSPAAASTGKRSPAAAAMGATQPSSGKYDHPHRRHVVTPPEVCELLDHHPSLGAANCATAWVPPWTITDAAQLLRADMLQDTTQSGAMRKVATGLSRCVRAAGKLVQVIQVRCCWQCALVLLCCRALSASCPSPMCCWQSKDTPSATAVHTDGAGDGTRRHGGSDGDSEAAGVGGEAKTNTAAGEDEASTIPDVAADVFAMDDEHRSSAIQSAAKVIITMLRNPAEAVGVQTYLSRVVAELHDTAVVLHASRATSFSVSVANSHKKARGRASFLGLQVCGVWCCGHSCCFGGWRL